MDMQIYDLTSMAVFLSQDSNTDNFLKASSSIEELIYGYNRIRVVDLSWRQEQSSTSWKQSQNGDTL